ncbi:hypothetical protein HY009_00440, partial [Candidatus Acetothermia bacterium]|nr:hypothetical protein [Candidatus Acetothermia bacterium]
VDANRLTALPPACHNSPITQKGATMNEMMSSFSSVLVGTAALLVGVGALLVAVRIVRFLDVWEERLREK